MRNTSSSTSLPSFSKEFQEICAFYIIECFLKISFKRLSFSLIRKVKITQNGHTIYFIMKKKNIIIIVFSVFCLSAKAQNVTDTLAYLNQVEANQNLYINKPLDSLLSKLSLNVVQINHGLLPLPQKPAILYADGISIFFDDRFYGPKYKFIIFERLPQEGSSTPPLNTHIPGLIITFVNPVPVPKEWTLREGYLYGREWNANMKAVFGPALIANIEAVEY